MDQLLEFFHSEHNDDILGVDLHILQYWLVVDPTSKDYTLSTVFFHKHEGEKFGVTNLMSHFSMFLPTKANVKLSNGNTGHAQLIGNVLCFFTNYPIIYPVGTFYSFLPFQYHVIGCPKMSCWFEKCYLWLSW